jgi:CRISPR system Cascade subunit CasA
MRFNVLSDPWIPLDVDGATRWTTLRELLTGAVTATDLAHPREDFRAFARMLLSALLQALAPAGRAKELEDRIADPMDAATVDALIAEHRDDFELIGPRAFLQTPSPEDQENETASLLLDVSKTSGLALTRHGRVFDGLCAPCAVLAVYGAQAFAPSGGRGYSPGVRGAPPLTTLVWQPSVRATAWANTLHRQSIGDRYPAGPSRPWIGGSGTKKPADAIGLVEGLFWQPRSLELRPVEDGACATCGVLGPRVGAFGVAAGAKVVGGTFRHPHTPLKVVKKETRTQHIPIDRPVWTGLADMLSTLTSTDVVRAKDDDHAIAAPVVAQWFASLNQADVQLLIFAVRTDNAKLLGRFSETYSLSMQLGDMDGLVNNLRPLVEYAIEARDALRYSLGRAWSDQKDAKGSFWPEDAQANFWSRTEPAFWSARDALQRDEDPTRIFVGELRRVARDLFDQNTAAAALETRHQRLVAAARTSLHKRLDAIARPGKETAP